MKSTFPSTVRALAVSSLLLMPAAAHAQADARSASRADPANPDARVPSAVYHSSFAGYRAMKEPPVGDWRAANDEVGRIGGWRAYAREAQGAAPAAVAPAAGPASGPARSTGAPPPAGHTHGGRP